ncbi:hypothetical protein M4D71_23420 [Niallia taxi]|uniref:hypothetical protein n=1 Tax=Niallia taxi TaxID=2499688 RepID=UPI0021A5C1C5|nr:hypothetical protein [Niallia taxi]MCT2347104.1 hypothetical protein [Niallia taxi]
MEARLAKMRIVGLRYDSAQISTKNLELDFTVPEQAPGHGGYVLRNAGGKGVFLQSLIQPLEPGAAWKQGKNKVSHFFFNTKGQPVDYTFHIIQEWYLTAHKSVILGYSVAPKIVSNLHRAEDSSPIQLDYITYVKETGPGESVDIFSLPLWDEKVEEPTSLVDWKKSLAKEKNFVLYYMQDMDAYREKLEEYGVTENTVSMIKRINTGEYGFGDFFDGATDNTGLFYQLLIPTLNDKIEGIDSRNRGDISTVTMSFLDTLKIAKALPELLAIIDSVDTINDILSPLKERLEDGKRIAKEREELANKGAELLKLLKVSQQKKKAAYDEEKLNQQLRKTELHMANWKFQNVDYIAKCQERNKLEEDYETKEQEQVKKDVALRRLKEESENITIHWMLKEKEGIQQKIEEFLTKVDILSQSEEGINVTSKMEKIKQYFQEHWKSFSSDWQKEMTKHRRSVRAHYEKVQTISDEINEKRTEQKELEYAARDMEKAIQLFEEKVKIASDKYATDLNYLLSDVLDEARDKERHIQQSLTELSEEIEALEEMMIFMKMEKTKEEQILSFYQEEIACYQEKIVTFTKIETETLAQASQVLKMQINQEPDREAFSSIQYDLKKHLLNKKEEYQQYLRQKWTLLADTRLIEEGDKEGCFVTNSDLIKVKELLDSHRIDCMYGTKFLRTLSKQEAVIELKRNPAIRYSIVVLEDKFDTINYSFLEQELIRSHVTLLDRTKASRMNEMETSNPSLQRTGEAYYLPKELTQLFVEDDYEYQLWKTDVEKQSDDIEFEIETHLDKIAKTEAVIEQVAVLLKGTLSIEWEEKMIQTQKSMKTSSETIESLRVKIEKNEMNLLSKRSEETKRKEVHMDTVQDIEELVQLQQDMEEIEETIKEKSTTEGMLERVAFTLSELEKELDTYKMQWTNNDRSYETWLRYVKDDFAFIRKMVPDIQLPKAEEVTKTAPEDLGVKSYPRSLAREASIKMSDYNELENNLKIKDTRIIELQVELKHSQGRLFESEEKLQEYCGDKWLNVQVPDEDILHLHNQMELKYKEVKEKENEVTSIQNELTILLHNIEFVQKEVNAKKEELEKEFPEEGAKYQNLVDCAKEKEKYRKERKQLNTQSKDAEVRLSGMEATLNTLESTIYTLTKSELRFSKNATSQFTDAERVALLENPREYFEEWRTDYNRVDDDYRGYGLKIDRWINQFKEKVESMHHLPERFKEAILHLLTRIRYISYDEALTNLDNYFNWARETVENEKLQKEKAEKAVELWVNRASRRVIQIVRNLIELTHKMTIVNWAGERFPIIKFNKNFPFPQDLEDVSPLIKEYCLNEIDYYVKRMEKNKTSMDEITIRDISKSVNISNILLKALGDFPKLMIHIPGMEGSLLRGESKYATYKEWEVINRGNYSSATKSGGQTLLAQFVVIAMLMRQRVDENSSLFLVTDNPFGAMSANELVEATFVMFDLLNIQWLVVSPPTNLNAQISSKFHTMYHMDIVVEEGKQELRKQNLIRNYRKFLDNISLLENPEEKKKDA